MQTIFVVGAGFMGAGIAQVCIQRGYRVVLSDKEADALERAAATIKWSLDKLQHKGLIQEPATSLLGRKSGQGFYRYDRKEKHKGDMP